MWRSPGQSGEFCDSGGRPSRVRLSLDVGSPLTAGTREPCLPCSGPEVLSRGCLRVCGVHGRCLDISDSHRGQGPGLRSLVPVCLHASHYLGACVPIRVFRFVGYFVIQRPESLI